MDDLMNDPREIITETYEDLKMEEINDEYERQLEFDFDSAEGEYLDEDTTYGHTPDDEEYYPEDEEDFDEDLDE